MTNTKPNNSMTTLKNDEAIYRKIRKKLYTLLGHNIEEKMLRSLISTWHAPTSIIKQASDAQTNVDYEIEKTLSALKNFKSGIRGINSYKNLNSTFIARPPVAYLDTDKFIFQLNEQLFFLEEHHSYLMQLKSSIGQDTAKLVAMNIILDYCKKLGLENDGKIGAGNGNKNKPIQFASIITGLSLKTVRIYYKNCMQRITPASELIPLI